MAELPAGTFAYATGARSFGSATCALVLDSGGFARDAAVPNGCKVVGFSPDHTYVYTESNGATAGAFVLQRRTVLDLAVDATTTEFYDSDYSADFVDVAYSADAALAALWGRPTTTDQVHLVDTATMAVTTTAALHLGGNFMADVALTPDGSELWVGYESAPYLRRFATVDMTELALPSWAAAQVTAGVHRIKFSPAGTFVCMRVGTAHKLIALGDGSLRGTVGTSTNTAHISFAPDDSRLALSLQSGTILRLYDISGGGFTLLSAVSYYSSAYAYGQFTGYGSRFALGSDPGMVFSGGGLGAVIDADATTLYHVLTAQTDSVAIVPAFSGPPPVIPPFWTNRVKTAEIL